MELASIPTKIQLAWAADAGGPYIRTVPVASQIGIQNGAASFTDGFPPLCFSPVAAGGVPPFGQDFNGIYNLITKWLQWTQAGGALGFYDATWAAEVGGYPRSAMLQAIVGPGNFWISTIDNNENDPDIGGSGWVPFPGPALTFPSTVQTTNATFDFNCDTDYSLGLNRSAPSAMTANLAATGSLLANQVFEIEDLSGNLDLGPVTVAPPVGHTIGGAANFIMTNQRQSCRFKYYGTGLWSVRA